MSCDCKNKDRKLTDPDPYFKRGELIEVSDGTDFCERFSTGVYIGGAMYPHLCVHGSYNEEFKQGQLFLTEAFKYARRPRPDLKVDDPVLVWDHEGQKPEKRHFACWENDGRIRVWQFGRTSWSVLGESKPVVYAHYKIPEK